jgi:cytoskeletal protein CcmA (bactofilin family)
MEKAMEKGSRKGDFTMIGEGSVFEGTISAPHYIRIDGTARGKIETTDALIVGTNGIIEADVHAKSAVIGGKVKGNLVVEDRVELESKATLVGDLKTRDLVINEGCIFHGNCSMEGDKAVKI